MHAKWHPCMHASHDMSRPARQGLVHEPAGSQPASYQQAAEDSEQAEDESDIESCESVSVRYDCGPQVEPVAQPAEAPTADDAASAADVAAQHAATDLSPLAVAQLTAAAEPAAAQDADAANGSKSSAAKPPDTDVAKADSEADEPNGGEPVNCRASAAEAAAVAEGAAPDALSGGQQSEPVAAAPPSDTAQAPPHNPDEGQLAATGSVEAAAPADVAASDSPEHAAGDHLFANGANLGTRADMSFTLGATEAQPAAPVDSTSASAAEPSASAAEVGAFGNESMQLLLVSGRA